MPLRLKSTLLYENSHPVRAAPDEQVLLGNTDTTMTNGRADVKLQLGKRALSTNHERQRFRIKIEPADPQLAAAYPTLTQLTEPLKSVTKLHRSGAPRPAAAQPPSPLPNYGNGLGGGGALLFGDELINGAALPPTTQPPAAAAASSQQATGSSGNGASGSGEASSSELQGTLQHARGERASLEEIVRRQKEQIEQLGQQNVWMMEEIQKLRKERG